MSLEAALHEGMRRMAEVVAPPDTATFQRLLQHSQLLERWNKTHNLTSVKGDEQWAEALFVDSWLVRALPAALGAPLIDVGSGGGFPALVLLAAEPSRPALFFEKVDKKRSFLAMAVASIGLKQAMVAREAFPPSFALPPGPRVFTSRATFAPSEWLTIAADAAEAGDAIIVQASQEELPDAPPNFTRTQEIETALPFSGAKRRLASYVRKA